MTIKEIADLIGVSTATVSRVINGNGFVKESTRKKIVKAVKENNYDPKSPRKRRGSKVSLSANLKYRHFTMIWASGQEASAVNTGQKMMLGVTEAARSFGVSLNIDYISPDNELPDVLTTKKTDGVFLVGKNNSEKFISLASKIPSVWLLQAGCHDFGDRVQPDHEHAGLIAYRYFRDNACKNLCCISCNKHSTTPQYWQTREEAFVKASKIDKLNCHVINLDFDDNVNSSVALQTQMAKDAVEQIKSLSQRPDGLFVANTLGSSIHAELTAQGIIPMKDILMVAGDEEICSAYLNPEPVKINIYARQLGKLALEAMLWRLRNTDLQQISHYIKPSLLIPTSEESAELTQA